MREVQTLDIKVQFEFELYQKYNEILSQYIALAIFLFENCIVYLSGESYTLLQKITPKYAQKYSIFNRPRYMRYTTLNVWNMVENRQNYHEYFLKKF